MSEQTKPPGIEDPRSDASTHDIDKVNRLIEREQAKNDARLAQLLEIERTSKALIEAMDHQENSYGEISLGEEDWIAIEKETDRRIAAWRKAVKSCSSPATAQSSHHA